MIAILLIIIGIGGLIFVHELGHFLVAKWSGVKVEVFSIGFGWKFLKYTYGETEYALSAIPLGGYVKMAGEIPGEGRELPEGEDLPDTIREELPRLKEELRKMGISETQPVEGSLFNQLMQEGFQKETIERYNAGVEKERELHSKAPWKRFWIFAAGSLMNLIVAFPLCILMYWIGVEEPNNEIGVVRSGSPEWTAGVKPETQLIGLRVEQPDGAEGDKQERNWGPKYKIDSLGEYQQHLIGLDKSQKVKLIFKTQGASATTSKQEAVIDPGDPISGGPALSSYQNVVRRALPNRPADHAGLRKGDRIQTANGIPVYRTRDLKTIIQKSVSPTLSYLIENREGKQRLEELTVAPGTPYMIETDRQTIPLYNLSDSLNVRKELSITGSERIVRINNHEVEQNGSSVKGNPETLSDVNLIRAASPPIDLKVLRKKQTNDGTEYRPKTLTLYPMVFQQPDPSINLLIKPIIDKVQNGSPADRAGLKSGDEIESVNGQPVPRYIHLEKWLKILPNRKLDLRFKRPRFSNFEVARKEIHPEQKDIGGAIVDPRTGKIKRIQKDSRANRAGVEPGDQIHAINENDFHTLPDLKKYLENVDESSFTVKIVRDYSSKKTTLTPSKNKFGEGTIGITVNIYQPVHPLPELPDDSGLAKSGFRAGDRIQGFFVRDQKKELKKSFIKLINHLRTRPEQVKLVIRREQSEGNITKTYTLNKRRTGRIGVMLKPLTFEKRYPPVKGFTAGMREAVNMYKLTILGIKEMFSSTKKAKKSLAGPVRIFSISHRVAEQDLGQFLKILAMISISLGLLNLLPLPPLDGGHILFLIIEKLKGEPLGEDTLYLIQMIGFLFLLAVIILVTYNDILHLIGG